MTHRKLTPVTSFLVLALLFAPVAEAKKKKPLKEGESTVAGTVVNHQGETLEGVLVTVTAAAPEGFRGEATTDKKGEFELAIPDAEGEYLLRLTKEGYSPFEVPVDFLAGERKNIDFTMMDEATGRRQEAIASFNAGVHAFNAGDQALAKEKFLAAAELSPAFAEPLLPLAQILLTDGDYAQAAVQAEKYLALAPEVEDDGGGRQGAQLVAYNAYRKLGNQAKVDELRAALGDTDLSPQLAVQVYNEGAAASQKNDWDGAIARFREAVELDPSLASAHGALAQIYYAREAFEESLAAAEKLLELDSESVQGRRYRYLVLDARGDAGAAAALDAYAAVDPQGAGGVLYQLADLDFRRDDREAARSKALKAVELDPALPRLHYLLGQIYAATDPAQAKLHLQKFLELAPDDPEAGMARDMLKYF